MAGGIVAGSTAGTGTCVIAVRSSGRRLQSCFSGLVEFFPGRSHWPDLLQHDWCLPGNMKYCSHETHPPQRKVPMMTSDSSELAIPLSTLCFHYAPTRRGSAGTFVIYRKPILLPGRRRQDPTVATIPIVPTLEECAWTVESTITKEQRGNLGSLDSKWTPAMHFSRFRGETTTCK
jgi:hypothetical protein